MLLTTVLVSLISVVLRGSTSVIDRYNFGIQKRSIVLFNFLNNFVPFILLGLFVYLKRNSLVDFLILFEWKTLLFGFSIQIVAFAFSFGFKHFTVSKINIAARLGDILIPISLLIYGLNVGLIDFVFAISISICSFFAFSPIEKIQDVTSLVLPTVFITGSLILQSLCGEIFFHGKTQLVNSSLELCLSTMFGRSLLCFAVLTKETIFNNSMKGELICLKNNGVILQIFYRSFFTIGSQLTFIYVLANGNRLIAWPILNSVAVFSIALAHIFIKELVTKREISAVIGVVIISFFRFFIGV